MPVCIKNHKKKELIKPVTKLDGIYNETEELIAIIATSIKTASINKLSKPKSS